MVIDCLKLQDQILEDVKKQIKVIKQKNIKPKMVIFKNNFDPASDKYVSIKLKKAIELGIETTVIGEFKTQEQLINLIKKANVDKTVHGYIVQLPLEKEFDQKEIFEHIDINKDIDGLSALSCYRNFVNAKHTYFPQACTAKGIMHVLDSINVAWEKLHVVVINRSLIVGKPLIGMLLDKNATVTVCHSHTPNLANFTKQADVVIIATGVSLMLKKSMLKKNSIVIDAGISFYNNKLVGDCDFDDVIDHVSYITKVPNGIGKMTVAFIFKNLVDLINNQIVCKLI